MTAVLVFVFAWAPLCDMDRSTVDGFIRELQATHPTFEQRLTAVVQQSLGTSYADGPLGEGPEGQFDKDPLIDLTKADCVTLIEQSIAVAAASNYDEMFRLLQEIRYKDGSIDFESRNHFFVSDWIENNPFCVEVTDDLNVVTKKIKRTISRKDFFKRVNAPGLGQDTPNRTEELLIVPPDQIEMAEIALPSPSIIVFVGKVEWLFALHTGLFIRDESGVGRLYHASSREGKVVATDLSEYFLEQSDRYVGISAFRLTEPIRNE